VPLGTLPSPVCVEAQLSFGSHRLCAAYFSAQGYSTRVIESIEATIAVAIPADACSPLQNAPQLAGRIVVVDDRGECPVADRIFRAQSAAALAVIIVNGSDVDLANITIPAARVSREAQTTLDSLLGQRGTMSLGKLPRNPSQIACLLLLKLD
jgi:hypothetical protein